MNVEKWINELQIAVADLARKIREAAVSAFSPDIETPSDGQIIIYDATAEKWKNADMSASGTKITSGGTIGAFPENPSTGDLHYLVDADGRENAAYRYDGEVWKQLNGFNYQLSDATGASIINGYGLYDVIKSSAAADFAYKITELGYQLRTGSGTFTTYFYIDSPVIIDPAVFSGFTITGKYRGAALEVTVDWTQDISTPYCGILMIAYNTDMNGNWLSWQLCRPYLIETGNNALHQGNIVEKQGGSSGDFIITSLKLNKVETTTSKRRKTK